MSRPIPVNPRGGPISVVAQMLMPGEAPVKIDLWRRVRHPPPDYVHAFCLKPATDTVGDALVSAGHPMKLVGKMISFVFDCRGLSQGHEWRVLIDVLQDDASVPGYPFVHSGPMPGNHPLAMLKITELVVDHHEQTATRPDQTPC